MAKLTKTDAPLSLRLADLASLAVILGIAWYGVFFLPYWFPPKVPVFDSPSYNVGFNNTVASKVVVVIIGLLFLRNLFWRPRMPEPVATIFWTGASCGARRRPRMPWSLLLLFGCIYAILTCFLYAYIPRLEEYGDAPGMIERLQLVLGTDLRPYRDFDFGYSPLMLYFPALVIKVATDILGATFTFGYFLSELLCQEVGLWMLFHLVDHFQIKTSQRMVIFSVIAIADYDIGFGISGTMLRFVTPYVITLTMHKVAERIIAGKGRWTKALLSAVSMLGIFGVLSISPEFGCVFLLAHAAYCAHRAWFQQRVWIFPMLATLACFPIWMVAFPGSLDRIFEVGRCHTCLPIVPAAFIVLYLLSLFWLMPILLRTCLSWKADGTVSFVFQWAVQLLGLVPPALARCEHFHVLFNGLGMFIVTLAVVAAVRPRAFPHYAVVFVFVFGVVWRVVGVVDYGRNLMPVRLALGGALPPEKAQTSQLVSGMDLVVYSSIATPLGIDYQTKKYLIESRRMAREYYQDYGIVMTEVELARKMRDLKNADYVLVPKSILPLKEMSDAEVLAARWKQQAQVDQQQSIWLGFLFLYPVHFQTKYLPFDPMLEEARYIARHYEVVREANGYLLMKPQTGN